MFMEIGEIYILLFWRSCRGDHLKLPSANQDLFRSYELSRQLQVLTSDTQLSSSNQTASIFMTNSYTINLPIVHSLSAHFRFKFKHISISMLPIVTKLLLPAFLLWVLLSTTLPQLYPQVSLARQLPQDFHNKNIQLLIAHPDDEVMFFGPSIVELLKPHYSNTLFVTCFSNGNDQGLGQVRAEELRRSLEILGIGENFELVDNETLFKDSMELEWDADEILPYVRDETDIILTFDEEGISSHPNHISMYKASTKSDKVVYTLKSWSKWEKYSWLFYTNIKLILSTFDSFVPPGLVRKYFTAHGFIFGDRTTSSSPFEEQQESVDIFTDLPGTVLIASAMMNAHTSQMVWFRYGWIMSGRYFNANELVRI